MSVRNTTRFESVWRIGDATLCRPFFAHKEIVARHTQQVEQRGVPLPNVVMQERL